MRSTKCTEMRSTKCTEMRSTKCTEMRSTKCTTEESTKCTEMRSTKCTAEESTKCTAEETLIQYHMQTCCESIAFRILSNMYQNNFDLNLSQNILKYWSKYYLNLQWIQRMMDEAMTINTQGFTSMKHSYHVNDEKDSFNQGILYLNYKFFIKGIFYFHFFKFQI